MTKKSAIFPGSFDPLTNGHIHLIERGLKIYDEIIVAIGINPAKKGFFSIDERLEMIKEIFANEPRVLVDSFKGFLTDYSEKTKVPIILRGLRDGEDFRYEFQLASVNRQINPNVETVFLMSDPTIFFGSSSVVREIATIGGSVEKYVPKEVEKRILQKALKG